MWNLKGGGGVEHVTLMACDIGGNTTILDKNLGTLWKILLPFVPLSLLQFCCSHVTLQSHPNITEGKGRA